MASEIQMNSVKDIPKRKPRDYPKDFRKWGWIGDVIMIHAHSRRLWGRKIVTFTERTERGKAMVWARFRRLYPWAFSDYYQK